MMNTRYLLLLIPLISVISGCAKTDTALRSETLQVWMTSTKEDLTSIDITPDGETEGQIHIVSSEDDLKIDFTDDESNWFRILSIEEPVKGHRILNFEADPVNNSMAQRYGMLNLTCADKYFGRFVKISQGYSEIYREDFSDEPSGYLVLKPGESYETGYIDAGINMTYSDYICFNACVECGPGIQTLTFPLKLNIFGGAVDDESYESEVSFEIKRGTDFSASTFNYVEKTRARDPRARSVLTP